MHIRRAIAFALTLNLASIVAAQILPPPEPPDEQNAGQDSPEVRDSIDSRAPEDRRVSTLLTRIEGRIRDGEWAIAVQQLQSILNQPHDGLVRLGPGRFISMRSAANKFLGQMPKQWKQRYTQQFGAAAQKNLDAAIAAGDYRAVGDVATRYLQTPAGSNAVRAIASRHFDRGEYGMALRWLEVLETKHGKLESTTDQLQRAAIQKLTGVAVTPMPEPIDVGQNSASQQQLLDGVATVSATVNGQANWPMLMGSASRSGYAMNRLPLLLKKWQQPLIQSQNTTDTVQRVIQEVQQSYKGLVLAGVPVVANNRVACRTIDGVCVFDTETGQLLWRTHREDSTANVFGLKNVRKTQSRGYRTSRTTDESIKDFFFRDAVHGLLSSDGQRLFVIEKQGMPTQSFATARFQNSRSTQLIMANATNVLAAYDLKTGSLLWSVGGADSTEAFKPVLAGHYFHGVPAAIGNDLFIVSEKNNAIRVQCLDAATGEQRWSQLLAFSDTKIERDFVRRHFTAQITVAEGMLLCPTTVDWLIAVNPLTRGIVWARRHNGPRKASATRYRQPAPPLGARWPAAAPVVVGNRVIFTPPEATHIECISLTTGEQVWLTNKGTYQYFAGVSGKNVIAVGSNRIVALQAATGRTAWTLDIDEGDSPGGRGVLSSNFLHQPMTSGQVLSINLQTGKIDHRTGTLRSRELASNLIIHAGGTLLQTPTTIEAFELRPTADASAARTPTSDLRSAEVAFADGNSTEAIAALDAIATEQLNARDKVRHKELLITALTTRIQAGADTAPTDLDRLEKLVTDDETVRRLRILHETAAQNFGGAFEQLIALYESQASPRIRMNANYIVTRDQWLAGQLSDAWSQMDDARRESFSEQIAIIAADQDNENRFKHVFRFHPLAATAYTHQLDALLTDNRFAEAEQIARTIQRAEPENNEAIFRCAEALAAVGQRRDAVSLLQEHGAAERIDELVLPKPGIDKRREWDGATWQVRQFVGRSMQPVTTDLSVSRPDVQFHRDHLCIAGTIGSKRLRFFSLPNETFTWSLPLRNDPAVRAAISLGRSLLVHHGTTLSCIAPLEKRVLWERTLRTASRQQQPVFVPLTAANSAQQPDALSSRSQGIEIANEEYVCIRGQRSIEIIDAVSGEFRWYRDDIRTTDAVIGTTEAVFIRGPERDTIALDANDGRLLPEPSLDSFGEVYSAIGRHMLAIKTTGLLFKKLRIRLYNPTNNETVWSLQPHRRARVAIVNEREMVISDRSQIRIINLITGDAQTIETDLNLDESPLVALAQEKLFVIDNEEPTAGQPSQQKVNGRLAVFDRTTGTKLWDRNVADGTISLSHFHTLPVLLLTHNNVPADAERPTDAGTRDLSVLDIQTGKEVARQKLGNDVGYGSHIRFDPVQNFVEIRASELRRFRFVATPKNQAKPADTVPPETPPKAVTIDQDKPAAG